MKLLHLKMHNWCQHRNRRIDFDSGLTAIIGPNGSGKTNLINAIYFAFTGESRNIGSKAENICQLAKPKEQAYVEVGFEHAGSLGMIRRNLVPTRNLLRIGDDEYRKCAEIDKVVEQVLGITKKVLSDFIFVKQKKLDGLLHLGASERAEAFQQIFGINKALVCFDAIGNHINSLKINDYGTDAKEIKSDIQKTEEELKVLAKKFNDLTSVIDENWDPYYDEDHILTQSYQEQSRLLKTLSEHRTQLSKINSTRNDHTELLKQLRIDFEDLSRRLDRINIKDVETSISYWQTEVVLEGKRQACSRKVEEINSDLIKLREEESKYPVVSDEEKLVLEQLHDVIHKDHQKKVAFVSAFKNKDLVECPTCSTPVHLLNMDVEYCEKESARLQIQYEDTLAKLRTISHNKKAIASVQQKIRDKEYNRTNLEDQFKNLLSTLPISVLSYNIAKEQQQEYKTLTVKLDSCKLGINTVQTTIKSNNGREIELKDSIEDLSTKLNPVTFTEEEVHEARLRLKTKTQLFHEVSTTKANTRAKKEKLEELNKKLEGIKKNTKKTEILKTWRAKLEIVRSVFHRDNSPKLLSQKYLELLESSINLMLKELDSPFIIYTAPDLSFRAVFPDSRDVPSTRLSEGEKAVLSLALRITINSNFAGEVGLVVFDEPFDSLDKKNLGCFETALIKLKALSKSNGMQVLVISHERSLMSIFDTFIEL